MDPRQRSLKWARAISWRAPTWRLNDSLVMRASTQSCSAVTASPCDEPDSPPAPRLNDPDPSSASSPK